jgi:hypothetical protein
VIRVYGVHGHALARVYAYYAPGFASDDTRLSSSTESMSIMIGSLARHRWVLKCMYKRLEYMDDEADS